MTSGQSLCVLVRPGIDSGCMRASCAVVRDEMVVVLSAFTPSEFRVAMSVETSGKVRLYATEALDPAAELTDELCIFCNHEINLTTSKQ